MDSKTSINSITQFRNLLSCLTKTHWLQHQKSCSQRHVIVLAIDGIHYECAKQHWHHAHIRPMQSVMPTTSATAWLSALTGLEVADHGIPGVIFRTSPKSDQLINIYNWNGHITQRPFTTIFSDARNLGFSPYAVVGDLTELNCSWRKLLLHDANLQDLGGLFSDKVSRYTASQLCNTIRTQVDLTINSSPTEERRLIWIFVDSDLYIHRHGYDEYISDFLYGIETLARHWANDGHLVVAHSDHGLVRTIHDENIAQVLTDAASCYDAPMGGAGRIRWFYVSDHQQKDLKRYLLKNLPDSVQIRSREEFFSPDNYTWDRVGSIIVIANGVEFINENRYQYEHGSNSDTELLVPFALW